MDPHFLSRHYLEVSGELQASVSLPQRKRVPVIIGYEAGWAPEQVWKIWKSDNPSSYRDSNYDHLNVATSQSLYRLRYLCSSDLTVEIVTVL
jgi:hypothetical protein